MIRQALVRVFQLFMWSFRALCLSRSQLALENLALRQQLAVLKTERPRPHLKPVDRIFWSALRRSWRDWANALIILKPETVVGCTDEASSSTGVGNHDGVREDRASIPSYECSSNKWPA